MVVVAVMVVVVGDVEVGVEDVVDGDDVVAVGDVEDEALYIAAYC